MTSRRWIIAAAFLAAPALAGCAAGFGANTNQPYAPNEAAVLIDKSAYGSRGVVIPQAFILGPDAGAQLAKGASAPLYVQVVNTTDKPDTLQAVTVEGLGTAKLAAPIQLPSNKLVNAGKPSPQILIEGLAEPLDGGESAKVTFQFANAGAVTMQVPVVTRSREYAQYPAAPGATPAPTPTATPTPSASESHSGDH
ncbi:hypothetical protein [Thermoactinospora rubra]|uniref:hypothetical protein n=1 Tax=Thermoactinospora rubra TaxID=1088767 RepID=UPI000A0FA7DD|nr:hypothetical protein [Thermoactinospora rubra]